MKISPTTVPFRRALRHLTGFSHREVRGLVLLLLLAGALASLPLVLRRTFASGAAPALAADEIRALNHLAGSLEQAEHRERQERAARYGRPAHYTDNPDGARRPHAPYGSSRPEAPVALLARLTPFDPNALNAREWQQRGVPADVARHLVAYGRKAGGYRYREQLERIHGLDPALLARLTPFLKLPGREEVYGPRRTNPAGGNYAATRPTGATAVGPTAPGTAPAFAATAGASFATTARPTSRKLRVTPVFDLNEADTSALMRIRGIGAKRAQRIVELRQKLGGFVSTEQLTEVWGLDPALLDTLLRCSRVAPEFKPRSVALNTTSLEDLRLHPYVGYRLARVIVAYREQHGPYQKAEDLLLIKSIDEASFNKLRPYVAIR